MRRRILGTAIAIVLAAGTPALAKAKQKVVRLKIGPFPIEANRDREVCQAFRVRGVPGMEVVSWEARSRYSKNGEVGSHHFVVYGYQGGGSSSFPRGLVENPGCGDFGPPDFFLRRVFLAGSGGESRRGVWALTKGGFPGDLMQPLPNPEDASSDAVIVLNSHYFNGSKKRARGIAKVTLKLAPRNPHKRVLRQIIHGDASRDIDVAPLGTGIVSSSFQSDGGPNYSTEGGKNPEGDVCVYTISTHMHKRGTLFTVDYEEGGVVKPMLSWPDYIHAGILLRPRLEPTDEGNPTRSLGLLRAHTAENGFPRIRYGCHYANGVEGKEAKMGCEEEPGVTPGMSWTEAEAHGISSLESHARPCGKDGINCEGKPCVPANLVFGPLSDDDMCILTALVYDPRPELGAERACDLVNVY
jgi:hypothetical protein